MGEEQRDTLALSVLSGLVERTVAISIREVGVGAILQQLFQQSDVVVKDGLGHDIRHVRGLWGAHLVPRTSM